MAKILWAQELRKENSVRLLRVYTVFAILWVQELRKENFMTVHLQY